MGSVKRERRLHKRWDLACPITLLQNPTDKPLFQCRCENVSDGGAYLTVRAEDLPCEALPPRLAIRLSVPRSTPNSFMFEEFSADATVVRSQPLVDARQAGLALRFAQPLKLDLED